MPMEEAAPYWRNSGWRGLWSRWVFHSRSVSSSKPWIGHFPQHLQPVFHARPVAENAAMATELAWTIALAAKNSEGSIPSLVNASPGQAKSAARLKTGKFYHYKNCIPFGSNKT
ncbi:hypothetical protein FF1_038711 [Malus domestica]